MLPKAALQPMAIQSEPISRSGAKFLGLLHLGLSYPVRETIEQAGEGHGILVAPALHALRHELPFAAMEVGQERLALRRQFDVDAARIGSVTRFAADQPSSA